MTRAEALRHLGLGGDASAEAIRAAYRASALRLHPDVAGDRPENHRRMTEINQAYALLTSDAVDEAPVDPDGWSHGPGSGTGTGSTPRAPVDLDAEHYVALDVALDVDGTLLVAAPAEETFDRLAEAAERVGDLTYVDRSAGLLQLIVRHQHGPWCYVTCSLQGRATATEVFTTIESIDGQPTPPVDDILALLADELRTTTG